MGEGVPGPRSHSAARQTGKLASSSSASNEEAGWITDKSGRLVLWEGRDTSVRYNKGIWYFNGNGKDPGFHIDLTPVKMRESGQKWLKFSVRGDLALNPGGKWARLEIHVSDAKNNKMELIVAEPGDRYPNLQLTSVFKNYNWPLNKELGPLTKIEVMLVTDNGRCSVEIKDLRVGPEGQ